MNDRCASTGVTGETASRTESITGLQTSGCTRSIPRCGIVSFHDLTPSTAERCARFLDRVAALGVARAALLAVPRWHDDPRETWDDAFIEQLRAWSDAGHEIVLHGYTHLDPCPRHAAWRDRCMARFYTNGEGEFFRLDEPTAAKRLAEGLRMLRTAQIPVCGFIAPAWLLGPEAEAAVVRSGLEYTVRFASIRMLPEGRDLPAPVLTFSTRAAWRRAVSRAWVAARGATLLHAPVLRLAAHPGDLKYPSIEDALLRAVARLMRNRRAVTYAQLVRNRRAEGAGL